MIQDGKEAIVSPGHSEQQDLKVQIRWLIRRDMPEVLDIERSCFEYVWTEEDFLCCLRQRNCIGMVAEHDHEIVGFMIYELHKMKLRIINFAVAPAEQRQCIGSQMIRRLVEKLSQQRRKEIMLEVRESNLSAQMFFKEREFRAVRVLRNHYDDTTEDAYVMQYRLEADDCSIPFSPDNRISEFDAA
jgi:ribosomal-protein-alanine N-acetyltransferase